MEEEDVTRLRVLFRCCREIRLVLLVVRIVLRYCSCFDVEYIFCIGERRMSRE